MLCIMIAASGIACCTCGVVTFPFSLLAEWRALHGQIAQGKAQILASELSARSCLMGRVGPHPTPWSFPPPN